MTSAAPIDLTEPQPRRAQAMAMMIVSSISISFGGLALRSMEVADAWQINFYRSIALVAVISLVMVLRYGSGAGRQILRIGWPGVLAGAFLAAAGIAFLQSITTTTVANTLFTLSAIPFLTAGLAWLILGEPLRRSTLATMVVAALGVGIMMAEGIGGGALYGNAMALVTACCFSGFAILVRRNRRVDMLPALLVSGLIIMPISAGMRWDALDIPLNDILLCFLIGGLLSGLGNFLFVVASRHLAAAELTLFMLLEFALGPLWVWLVIAEVPSRFTIFGGAVVISAVLLRAVIELRDTRVGQRRVRPGPP